MAEETSLKLLDILDKLSKKVEEDVAGEKAEKFVFDEDVDIEFSIDLFERISELEGQIDKLGYKVEVMENLDIQDVSKGSKFIIRISNKDNCFVEINLFDYRKIMISYGSSEEEFIEDKLVAISGIGQRNLQEVSKVICEYLSYACYFKEVQVKLFSKIGWSTYDGKRVFLYDRIYDNESLYRGIEDTEEIEGTEDTEDIKDSLYIRSVNIDPFSENYKKKVKESNEIIDREVMRNWITNLFKILTYVPGSANEERKPYNSLILAAACTGLIRPLLTYSKENNINMNIVGGRAIGKSSLSHFALSLFGNPEQLEGSFLDSEEAVEIIRVKRPVIPYILDERMLRVEDESDKAKKKKVLMDIFREYEGKVKERMAGAGKDLSGERTYGPIISSSVEPMLDLLIQTNRDLGQYRRFIEINLKQGDITVDSVFSQEMEKLAYSEYGYGVKMIVTYILEGNVDIEEEYNKVLNIINSELEKREQIENKQGKTAVSGLESSASRFALIITTLGIMQDAMKYHLIKGMELIEGGIGTENTNKIETFNNIIKCNLFIKPNSNNESALTPNQEDVLKLLIDNLVEKMSRVTIKINVYDNIMRFIGDNAELFATNQTNYGKNTDKYIGFKEEINGGKEVKIGFRKDRGLEWIIAYLYKNMSTEEITDYIKGVSGTGTGYKDKMREVLGELNGRSLESIISSEDLDKMKIEYTNKISEIKNGVIITLKRTIADLEEGKA